MSKIAPIPSSGMGDDSMRDYLIEEFVEDYQDGRLTRREALKKLAMVFGSAAIASTFLAACAPPPAPTATPAPPTAAPTATIARPTSAPVVAGTVMPDDPAIEAKLVEYDNKTDKITAYLAKPKGNGPFPLVLVCHENRGLVDHIKDVARRFAKAGYAALAVDLLSREGGTAKVGDAVPGVLGNIPPQRFVDDFRAGYAYLAAQSFAQKDRAGMVGFCFGGGITWRVATQMPELKAAVPFYGPNPPLEDVPNVKAAILGLYGALDTRIDAGIPAIEDALKKNNKTFEKIIYDGANHAFNNDTGASYNATAAKDAWEKTLAWFDKYLRA